MKAVIEARLAVDTNKDRQVVPAARLGQPSVLPQHEVCYVYEVICLTMKQIYPSQVSRACQGKLGAGCPGCVEQGCRGPT